MSVRIGVFGIGFWGALTEAAAQWLPEVTIDRVWSRKEQRAAALANNVGSRVAASLEDVAGLDMAVAGLPPVAIPALADACLEHRVRCLLEKPVSLDPACIRALADRFEARDVAAAVNLQGRYVPAMHAVRTAVASGAYGRLREVDVAALGNRGCTASPLPHSWLHRVEDGGGVAGISGPHAAEFLVALAGPGQVGYARTWTEVATRPDEEGVDRKCTAADNVEVLTTHGDGVRGRLRLSTTARRKEETWSARCDGRTLRVGADDRAVVVENFGETTPLPCARADVLAGAGLADHEGLKDCPAGVFPALVLLACFARGDADVPDLRLLAQCMDLLA